MQTERGGPGAPNCPSLHKGQGQKSFSEPADASATPPLLLRSCAARGPRPCAVLQHLSLFLCTGGKCEVTPGADVRSQSCQQGLLWGWVSGSLEGVLHRAWVKAPAWGQRAQFQLSGLLSRGRWSWTECFSSLSTREPICKVCSIRLPGLVSQHISLHLRPQQSNDAP